MSIRLSGHLLLLGAIGTIISSLLQFLIPGPLGITGPGSIPTNGVAVGSGILLLAGLPLLYRAQRKQVRRAGLTGVAFLWCAIFLTSLVAASLQILDVGAPGSLSHSHEGPPLVIIIPTLLGALCFLIGGLMVGILTIRARAFSAVVGWLLMAGAVPLLLTIPLPGALGAILPAVAVTILSAGLAWAGATGQRASARGQARS